MAENSSCKNTLGKPVTRTAHCDLCKRELKYTVQPNQIVRAVMCDHCGETVAVAPPPPNNLFSRCPHCRFLLTHSVDATTVVCPRDRCRQSITVARGPTKTVLCDVCRHPLAHSGKKWLIVCDNCREATNIGQSLSAITRRFNPSVVETSHYYNSSVIQNQLPTPPSLQSSTPVNHPHQGTDESTCIELYRRRCLGQGSFGTVYRGQCAGIECAAKLITAPPPLPDGSTSRPNPSTVIQTMQPLCALSHPSLVRYIGVSSDPTSDLPVFAMELMRGNLTNFLNQIPEPTPLHVQLEFAHDISQALSYLHGKGIIHGNLCGTNVLLNREGCVKVSDYEVLSIFPYVTVQQMGPKTIPYMPPEAFSVPPFRSEKVDFFSWSVLTLQIITQKVPSPGPRVQTITDPRSLGRPLQIPVSEVTRRKSHIDAVDFANPLLSVLVLGLDDVGERRPSMAEVGSMISLIKSSEDYKLSQQRAGADWSKRQLFVFEYEPVVLGGQRQQAGHSKKQVEETGTQLGHLSLQSEGEGAGEAQQVEDGKNGEVGENGCATGGVSMNDAAEKENEVVKFLESEDTGPEPTAPPEPVELGDSEATAVSTLPPLPPYSVLPPSQHTNVGPPMPPGQYTTGDATQYGMQAPPPYSPLPPQYTQPPPLSGVATQVNGQSSGQLHDFQCAVCKRKSKYRQPPGRRIAHVKCSTCKECTPVGPAPDGKVYERCTFCKCLLLHRPEARRVACPRETCKELLLCYTTTGKVLKRRPCEVCRYVMQNVHNSKDTATASVTICSQCGEANSIGPAPPGKHFTRCPYCNVLISHNISSSRVACPRSSCQKMVEVGNGEKLSVKCEVCQKIIIFYGRRSVVMCGHCSKCTVVGAPPAGKEYARCSCKTLLICDRGKSVVRCPMKNCGNILKITAARRQNTGPSTTLPLFKVGNK